jgi:hypothetical protein
MIACIFDHVRRRWALNDSLAPRPDDDPTLLIPTLDGYETHRFTDPARLATGAASPRR